MNWTDGIDGSSEDTDSFCIHKGELWVYIENHNYSIAKGDHDYLKTMAAKYKEMMEEAYAKEHDGPCVMMLPMTDEVRVLRFNLYDYDTEWSDPMPLNQLPHYNELPWANGGKR